MNIQVRPGQRGYIPIFQVLSDGEEIGYIFKHEGSYRINLLDPSSKRLGKGFKRISEAIGAIVARNFENFDSFDEDLSLDDFAQELRCYGLLR